MKMRNWVGLAVVAMMVAVLAGCQAPTPAPAPQQQQQQQGDVTYEGSVYFPAGGDQMVVASGGELEVQSGGGLDVQAGATAIVASALSLTGGVSSSDAVYVNAPTAVATATPALFVNSLGVSNLFEVRDAATPVFVVGQAGASTLGGALAANGGLSVDGAAFTVTNDTGAVATTGGLTVAGLVKGTSASPVTATNGAAFAISGWYQPISAAGTVTPTITIPAAGTAFCIYNTSANTINIADSGNQVLTSAFAMGQYDVLCAYSDGTRILETARANN